MCPNQRNDSICKLTFASVDFKLLKLFVSCRVFDVLSDSYKAQKNMSFVECDFPIVNQTNLQVRLSKSTLSRGRMVSEAGVRKTLLQNKTAF